MVPYLKMEWWITVFLFIYCVTGALTSDVTNNEPEDASQQNLAPNTTEASDMFGVNLMKPMVVETLKTLGTEIELSITAMNLPSRHKLSLLPKSNVYCVTFLRKFNDTDWVEYHRTETFKNNLNPTFFKKPVMPPSFREKYSVMFKFFDGDMTSNENNLLAYVECNLKELFSSTTREYNLWEIDQKTKKEEITTARLIIKPEELIDNNDEVRMELGGKIEEKRAFLKFVGGLNPYIVIQKERINSSNSYIVVHRTKEVLNSYSPEWPPFEIALKSLCNRNDQRTLKFTCFTWDNGFINYIGEFQTSLQEMGTKFDNGEQKSFQLENLYSKKLYKTVGYVKVINMNIIKKPNFEILIKDGLRIHCNIAIDFSGTNGNTQNLESPHFLNPNGALNKYQEAINLVVNILDDYIWDKNYKVFGFGAEGSGSITSPDDFDLNPNNMPCRRVNGVLDLYRKSLSDITPKEGPVKFGPVIRKVTQIVENTPPHKNNYFVLVIFTTGETNYSFISDSLKAAKEASKYPISIIVVGIGINSRSNKFALMDQLDGDLNTSIMSQRDIVQFVPFDKFTGISFEDEVASLNLAKELLEELPKQVMYIMPNAVPAYLQL